jgi:sugar O-acyltransferase (sialic acid O-acetyltransferase NeuD family)
MRVGVLGAGRQAFETASYCQEAGFEVAFCAVEASFVAETPSGALGEVVSVTDVPAWARRCPVVAGVGDPMLRRRLVAAWPEPRFQTVRGPMTWVAGDAVLGAGATIAPGACISRNARVGAHVIVNLGATISHDVTIGDFVTVSPGCHLAGRVRVGDDAYLGIGAIVLDGRRVGRGAVVGAGAVVVHDVPDGSVVKGVPAR